jgi:uracil-DNA glycosylase family 4
MSTTSKKAAKVVASVGRPRELELSVLEDKWAKCTLCPELARLRGGSRTLRGVDNGRNFLFVIGAPDEAASMNREILNRGSAQGLSMKTVMEVSGFSDEEYYVIPALGCRAFTHIPRTEEQEEEFRDRKPTKEEIDNCRERLHEYIYAVDPEVVIVMGATAWSALTKTDRRYTTYTNALSASTFLNIEVEGLQRSVSYPALVCPGPEEFLKNPNTSAHGPSATAIRLLSELRENYAHMENTRCQPHSTS